jgi:hypothetical protein
MSRKEKSSHVLGLIRDREVQARASEETVRESHLSYPHCGFKGSFATLAYFATTLPELYATICSNR